MVKIKQVKSQFIVIAAFVASLVIIFFIYDSNRQSLQAKISKTTVSTQSSQTTPENSAMAIMESVQKLLSDLKADPNNYDLIVQAGNAFFDIGRYNTAAEYYKKANSIQPVTEILIDLGVCYFNLGYLDSALTVMNDGIKFDPDHKQGLYNIGIVLYNLGDFNEAIAKWQHLIHVYPNTAEAIRVQQYINEIKDLQTGT